MRRLKICVYNSYAAIARPLLCTTGRKTKLRISWSFLATGRTLIDCEKRELVIRVNDQQVKINVFKTLRHPDEPDECQRIEVKTEFNLNAKTDFLNRLCRGNHCRGKHCRDNHCRGNTPLEKKYIRKKPSDEETATGTSASPPFKKGKMVAAGDVSYYTPTVT